MRRRDLLVLLAGAAGAAGARPLAAQTPRTAVPVLGLLSSASAEGFATLLPAFREGLKEAGYREGENVTVEYAWAAGKYDQLPGMAADLVQKQVAAIVAMGGAVAALAAKAATSTIPIVIVIGDDPVKFGLVGSLGRPGGNITGVTLFMGELAPKRLQLLAELLPAAALTMLVNPHNPNAEGEAAATEAAAQRSGRSLRVLKAGTDSEIDAALAETAQQPGAALIVATDPYFFVKRQQIAGLAARLKLPAIFYHRGFVAAGGLISYGATITEEYRTAGVYTGRILTGEKPGDLPILQPSKIELVLNAKAARELGITVPPTILARADEVIE
jgi:putative ABC transport system substrate-binding protein